MPNAQNVVPKKIRAFAFILVLIGISVGVGGYFKPDIVVPNFMANTVANHTIAMMFAGRNLAMGIAMLLVLLWGVPEKFVLIFGIRFMIELADLTATLANAASMSAVLGLVIFLCVFLVLEAWVVITMLNVIRKRSQGMA